MTTRKGDFYSRKARQEHYRARSVYKLQEIHHRYRIFKKGDRVLDLGCAPGSWAQFALKEVGPKGWVAGVDTSPVPPLAEKNFQQFTADVFHWNPAQQDPPLAPFDVLLSDMAPSTTGIKIVDREQSYQLSLRALELAEISLKPGGRFVCKIFQGEDWGAFVKNVKKYFLKTAIFKPRATRKESVETYIIGLGKK
jgi:23S rRNA (uridine2552-2'-O)-methyltransferase